MRAESRAAFDEAQKLSWRANNARSQCWEVDLHGLGHVQALAKFTQLLSMLRGMDHPGGVLFRVVVGQGHHSEGNVPKIKHGVLQYLAEQGAREEEASGGAPWAVTWEVGPANAGVINVMIPAGSGGGVGGGGAE
jgi:DNA-nicking Smr family endonuclease